jgi:hypothetical protein
MALVALGEGALCSVSLVIVIVAMLRVVAVRRSECLIVRKLGYLLSLIRK